MSDTLKSAILAAAKQADGLKTSAIEGYTVMQVGRMVQKLQSAHLIFRAPTGGKHGRYFDTLTRAEAFANAKRTMPVPGVVAKRQVWAPDLPMIVPAHIVPKISPTAPSRYAPEPGFRGEFSSLRFGEYAAPPSTCAARAA